MNEKITADMVKELREKTGVSMGKCKEALVAAHGNLDEAIAYLRKTGVATAVKKEGRETKEGVIKTAENDAWVGLVEVNAETDFVVKNERFQHFAESLVHELIQNVPGNLEEFLIHRYSKDRNHTIDELRASMVQTLGENIRIKRFELYPRKKNASIGIYSHGGGKLVTLVEVEGSEEEKDLARDIAMHVAAEFPDYLDPSEVPESVKEHEREIARALIKNKPAEIQDKIIAGKLEAYYDQSCLLRQKFVKDPSKSIADIVEKRGKEKGKKLKVSHFLRWRVGQ